MGQDVLLSHFVWCSYWLLVVVLVAGNGILGLVDHILHHVGLGIGIAAIPILLTAEGQDQLENEGQQQKPIPKPTPD